MSTMDRQRAAEVLGVRIDDDVDAIMAAYRRSTFNTHPDIPGGSAEEFVKVSVAKEVLLADDAEADEGQDDEPDAPASAAAVVAQPIQRIMWLAIARGSAAAVAVVILVIILAPTAPTTGPIIIVAAGYAAMKVWRATGSPRPWPLLLAVVRRDKEPVPAATKPRRSRGTRGRSLRDEDWSKPPREWG